MSVYPKDPVYDDLRDITPVAAVSKGDVALQQDVYGFYLYNGAINTETTFIYRCKQVLADKKTGTGENIVSGDKLYADPNDSYKVSPTQGAGYVFVGWAKETVAASATEVLMRWDGTLHEVL